MFTRRRALLAAPALFASNAIAQIRRGDELTVGVWGGAQERILREFVSGPLEAQHGVKINYVLGGTTERRARAYAERGRPSFDLLYLNIFESRQAVRDGVTQAANTNVPNAQYLYPVAKLGGYGVAFNPVTIVYDRRLVAAHDLLAGFLARGSARQGDLADLSRRPGHRGPADGSQDLRRQREQYQPWL